MKSYIKKIGGFSLGPILTALIGLIIVPLTTRFITVEEYGRSSMFVLAQGIISMVVCLCMDQAYIREFNHEDDKRKLIQNALFFPLLFSVLISVLIVIFSEHVSLWLFGTRTEYLAVYMMALMVPFIVLKTFTLASLRMKEKGLLYSLFSVLLKVLVLLFTLLLFFLYEKSFRSVVFALALSEIIEGIILSLIFCKDFNFSRFRPDKELLFSMLRFSLPLIPSVLLSWALSSTDQIMLRSLCTYSELGLYSAAHKIVSILSIIQTCFTTVWTPIYFRWYKDNVSNERYAFVMQAVCYLMSVLCFGVLLCKDVLGWILGGDFVEAISIFPFLLLHPVMYTMSEATVIGIFLTRKTRYNIWVSVVAGVANIALNYCLIPFIGGRGAALATGVSYLIFFWVRTLISRKIWHKFPIIHFVVCSAFIMINCVLHTFLTGWIPYAASLISLLVFGLIAFKQIRKAWKKTSTL